MENSIIGMTPPLFSQNYGKFLKILIILSWALQGNDCRLQFWSILVQAAVDDNSDVFYNLGTEFIENLLQEILEL